MIRNSLNPFRWYTDLSKQDHKKWYAYGQKVPFITPAGRIPKFQITRDTLTTGITEFVLIDHETQAETDILATMNAQSGLYVESAGGENYSLAGSTPQVLPGAIQSTSWGFTFGQPDSFRFLDVHIFTLDVGGDDLPSNAMTPDFRAIVRDAKGGNILALGNLFNVATFDSTELTLTFDFGAVIPNANADALWLELSSDTAFCPSGRDSVLLDFAQEQGQYGTTPGLGEVPDTDAPGGVGDYDGHVSWYGGNGYDTIINPQDGAITPFTDIGVYELRMSDGTNTWYSELFVFCDVTDMIKLTYWNRQNFEIDADTSGNVTSHIEYESGYQNEVYFKSDIGRPEYPETLKVETRKGYPFFIEGSSAKLYKFDFVGVEYMLDALRIVFLHDDVKIEFMGETYDVIPNTFRITHKWIKGGHLADINIEFRSGQIAYNAGNTNSPIVGEQGAGFWELPNGGFWFDGDGNGWGLPE